MEETGIQGKIEVLIVLPTQRDRLALRDLEREGEGATKRYHLHWVDDPEFLHYFMSPHFNLVTYLDRCSAYIQEHSIQALFYSHDLGSLVAAVLAKKYGLAGPSIESMFLCNHKYYSRSKEVNPIWFDFIHLDSALTHKDAWMKKIQTYPVYVKPPCLGGTILQFKVNSPDKMERALQISQVELPLWSVGYTEFFQREVDLTRYPLANQNIMMIEELVEGASQHCIEGYVDPEGVCHLWAVSDSTYYGDGSLAIDVYSTPSRLSKSLQKRAIEASFEVVQSHGIRSGFWNVELWIKGDRIIITEVNGRAASVWESFYQGAYGVSLYRAMMHLACNELEECRNLAPKSPLDPGFQARYAGQFHVVTFGEGLAKEFLDFEYVRSLADLDVALFVEEDTHVYQSRTSGFWLARFELFGDSYEEICIRADQLRGRMLKKPWLSPGAEPKRGTSRASDGTQRAVAEQDAEPSRAPLHREQSSEKYQECTQSGP